MHRPLRSLGLVAAVALTATACQDPARHPLAPSLAKGGPTTIADPRAAFYWAQGTQYGVRSDDRDLVEIADVPGFTFSTYDDGVCGVVARFFVDNGGGDATLQPEGGWNGLSRTVRQQQCGGTPRTLTSVYRERQGGDPIASEKITYANVNALWWEGDPVAPNPDTENRLYDFGFQTGRYCDFVNYGRVDGSENVLITPLPSTDGRRRWRIESQGAHMAFCQAKNQLLYMPFVLVVREKAPL